MSRIKTITKYSIAIALLALPTALFAQGPGFDDDVDDVPVDGGISLLVAAGVGYGAKKWNDARKKKEELKK
ncbi:MAG: hypothetical protein R2800_08530 [Flavipsychrobacter sp.]